MGVECIIAVVLVVFGALGRSRIVDYAGIDNDWTISLSWIIHGLEECFLSFILREFRVDGL